MQTNAPQAPAQPSAPIKFDRIAVGPNSQVEGQVVRNDNTPKGNAKAPLDQSEILPVLAKQHRGVAVVVEGEHDLGRSAFRRGHQSLAGSE